MKLSRRFFLQSLLALTCTAAVTLCAGWLFSFFYGGMPLSPSAARMILLQQDRVVYAPTDFSETQVEDVVIAAQTAEGRVTLQGRQYRITVEEQGELRAIHLLPTEAADRYYLLLVWICGTVFLLVFAAAAWMMNRDYVQNIVLPVQRLKEAAEQLSGGDLSRGIAEEGVLEIQELCRAVELLRIELQDSVAYREKLDDNRTFLISSISHDLRTPITALQGYLEGILDGVADTPEKQQRYLAAALDKTHFINHLMADLLLYVKLDLHQISYDCKRMRMGRYLEEIQRDYAPRFAEEDKKLSLLCEASEDTVFIDGERLRRVMQNLLDNALRHISKGTGEVTLIVKDTPRTVVVECRDNGCGIKPEDMPHIFERFYRGSPERRADGSTGLGLAIARLLVEGMEGRIWAVSHEGEGASFFLSLRKERRLPWNGS